MGSLAKYGALAGVGKGLQVIGEQKREERLAEEKDIRLEERQRKRDERLQKWQQERDVTVHEQRLTEGEAQEGLRRETLRIEREGEQDFKARESALDRESRELIARIRSQGVGSESRRRLSEWLAKGEDIRISSKQSPAGLETISIIAHPPSGKSFQQHNHSGGTVNFPEGRDPLDTAEMFNIPVGTKRAEKDEARDQILGRISSFENMLIGSIGSDDEKQALEFFQEKMGYVPLQYLRIKHAATLLGE